MSDDAKSITAAVKDYLVGMVFAEEAKLRRVLHPRWHCIGNFEGSLEWLDLDGFIDSCRSAKEGDPDPDFFWQVESLEITGDTAIAKVLDDYLGLRFTDYLTFLKIEGRWWIVNKVFHLHATT